MTTTIHDDEGVVTVTLHDIMEIAGYDETSSGHDEWPEESGMSFGAGCLIGAVIGALLGISSD